MPDFIQGLATFPGIQQVLSAEYTRSHGITPGLVTFEILPQAGFVGAAGPVVFTYGDVLLAFPDCKVDAFSFRFNDQGFIIGLQIFDRRWKWAFPTISGHYNVRLDDGSLDPLRVQTPQQLCTLLLNAMGETDFDVSQVPNNAAPEVDWRDDNAAQSLADLAQSLGCRVVLGTDDSVAVVPTGSGDDLPRDLPILADSLSINPPEKPDKLAVACGPSRFETYLRLAPVGQDTDATIKPIDSLSYKPAAGWEKTDPFFFSAVAAGLARDLARKTVWRWYQIQLESADASVPMKVPGYPIPIQDLRQILPVENVQTQTFTDSSGVPDSFPARVYGIFYDRKQLGKNTAANTEYTAGFSIDQERGIVQFADGVYQTAGAVPHLTLEPALIYLKAAFSIRDFTTWAFVRHLRTFDYGTDFGTAPRVLKHDEIQEAFLPIFDNNDQLISLNSNTAAVDQECDYWLTAAQLEYDTSAPEDLTYAGLVPIALDGAIQQVTWSVGPGGATTRATRNCEHSLTAPPYPLRRLLEQVRGSKLAELRKQVDAAKDQIRVKTLRGEQL
jgi:hypothetical protein